MAAGGGGALVSGNGKEAGKRREKGGKKSGKATDGERPYRDAPSGERMTGFGNPEKILEMAACAGTRHTGLSGEQAVTA